MIFAITRANSGAEHSLISSCDSQYLMFSFMAFTTSEIMNILPELRVHIPGQIGYVLAGHFKAVCMGDVIDKVTELVLEGVYEFRRRGVQSDYNNTFPAILV